MLVVVHKLVTHEYFLDIMQMPDMHLLIKYIGFANSVDWMCAREIMLCQLKPYLKKKDLTAKELFPLPIDDEDYDTNRNEISDEDIDWWNKNKDKLRISIEKGEN